MRPSLRKMARICTCAYGPHPARFAPKQDYYIHPAESCATQAASLSVEALEELLEELLAEPLRT